MRNSEERTTQDVGLCVVWQNRSVGQSYVRWSSYNIEASLLDMAQVTQHQIRDRT